MLLTDNTSLEALKWDRHHRHLLELIEKRLLKPVLLVSPDNDDPPKEEQKQRPIKIADYS